MRLLRWTSLMCVTAFAALAAQPAQGAIDDVRELIRELQTIGFALEHSNREVRFVMDQTEECGGKVEMLREGLRRGQSPRDVAFMLDGLEDEMRGLERELFIVSDDVAVAGERLFSVVAKAQKFNDRELLVLVRRTVGFFNSTKLRIGAANELFVEVERSMNLLRREIEEALGGR